MSLAYILSQVFTVIMYAVLVVSYLSKSRPKILILSIIAIILNATAYILLGAWTGLAMCGIAFARNLYSIWDEKQHKESKAITKRDIAVLVITIIAIIAVTIPTYNGFLSLMSVFATTLYTISIWQKSTLVYKFLGIPVGLLWITYNCYVGSFFGVVLEGVLCVVAAFGYFAALKEKKKHAKR